MTDSTSLSLLDRLRDNADNVAWARFYATYSGFISAILRKYGVGDHDADDICQEVMIVVQKQMPTFAHNRRKGAFRTWLRKVVVSQIGVLRRKVRQNEQPLLAEIEDQLGALDSKIVQMWDQEYNRAMVDLILDVLAESESSKSLDIFRRTFIQEIPTEQVARDLGMTKNAVVVKRCRLLAKAREIGVHLLE